MTAPTAAAMQTALAAMEQALVDLARAYHQYEEGYLAAAREVYERTQAHAEQRVQELDHVIGPARVNKALANRLRTVGLETVLEQPRDTGAFGPEWVTMLSEDIERRI